MRLRKVRLKNTSRILAKGLTAGNGFVLGADSLGEATWIQNTTEPYPYGATFTYSEAISAANSGLLLTGSYYFITNIFDYTNKEHDRYADSILVKALSATEFAKDCSIKFFNCDWNGVGVYTSSPIGGSSLDPTKPFYVGSLSHTYSPGDVVIFRTQDYLPYEMYVKNNVSSSNGTPPNTNPGFTKLEPNIKKGWIHEVCSCEWDWILHRLESRRDSNGNFYSLKITPNQLTSDKFPQLLNNAYNMSVYNPVQIFPWGSNKHKNNTITDSIFSSYFLEANYNKVTSSAIINSSFSINYMGSGLTTYKFNNNSLEYSTIDQLSLFNGSTSYNIDVNISNNHFSYSNLWNLTSSNSISSNLLISFQNNEFRSCNFDISNTIYDDWNIERNLFLNTSITNTTTLNAPLQIMYNEFNNCTFDYNTLGWLYMLQNTFENCVFNACQLGMDAFDPDPLDSSFSYNKANSFEFNGVDLYPGNINNNEFKGTHSSLSTNFTNVQLVNGAIEGNTFHGNCRLDDIQLNNIFLTYNHFLFGSGFTKCDFSQTVTRNYFTWFIDTVDFTSSTKIYESRTIKHFVKGKSQEGEMWIVEDDGGGTPIVNTYITTD